MTIFDDFDDRAALLSALDAAIQGIEDENGQIRYRLVDGGADELRATAANATRNAERAERRRQELERELATRTRERDEARAKRATPNDDLRDESARERIAELEATLAPLKEENARLKARETRREIEAQLVATARKLNCCESALRDVRRLAPNCSLGEDGIARAEHDRSLEAMLREEIALSPHWLNRSQGGAARASVGLDGPSARERFRVALAREDAEFGELIRTAPREPIERPF